MNFFLSGQEIGLKEVYVQVKFIKVYIYSLAHVNSPALCII